MPNIDIATEIQNLLQKKHIGVLKGKNAIDEVAATSYTEVRTCKAILKNKICIRVILNCTYT